MYGNLLGSGAVAHDKTEVGRRLDVIGYTIDLDTERVLIAKKNYLTALHGFVSTDLQQRINLRTAQRLASWGTRYGKICRVMRPFCGALNRLTQGRTDPHALFHVSDEAKVAIQCWRAMLCLVRYRETEFTRTLESFNPATPTVLVEFDSSLSGAGLIWFTRSNGAEAILGVSAVDLTFLEFGDDSSYQNLSEFLGAIIAVVGQVVFGLAGRSLALRGDSVTALTWAITERPRGSIVTKAAMIWSMLCVATGVDVIEITHIPGTENKRCDRLPRLQPQRGPSFSAELSDMGLLGTTVLDMDRIEGVVALCTLWVLALLLSLTALRPYGLVVSTISPLAFRLGFDSCLCRSTPRDARFVVSLQSQEGDGEGRGVHSVLDGSSERHHPVYGGTPHPKASIASPVIRDNG